MKLQKKEIGIVVALVVVCIGAVYFSARAFGGSAQSAPERVTAAPNVSTPDEAKAKVIEQGQKLPTETAN